MNFDSISSIACELINYPWQKFYHLNDCQKQADLFYEVLSNIVDRHAPLRQVRFKNNDKPWITECFKQLIERRDEAYQSGSVIVYKRLRNQVNRVRTN